MIFYTYDKITKEFLYEEEASLDEIATEKAKKPVYLVPANSTTKKVPKKIDGFVYIFKNEQWTKIEDNRGKGYWLPTDSYYDEMKVMKDLGKFPNNAIFDRPPLKKEEKEELVRNKRDIILQQTDIYVLPDFPITANEKEQYVRYRKYLRDIPQTKSFPEIDILSFTDWCLKNTKTQK